MDAGARNLYDTKKPIKSIADLKGMKFRVMGNPMFVDMMNALGGNGVAMGYDQVFSALQTGVVDGAENNTPSFVFDNHYQVAKYYTLHRAPDRAGNARVLEARSGTRCRKTTRLLLKTFGREAQMDERVLWNQYETEARDKAKAAGIRHHRRSRQEAVPGCGQAGLGQIRPEICRHDQAHPGRSIKPISIRANIMVRLLYRKPMDALYLRRVSSSPAARWC